MPATTTESPALAAPLGSAIPVLLPHAISVSLPTWRDSVGYEEGDSAVLNKLETGYPRFFIHRSIQKLQDVCLAKFGIQGESCMLFPSPKVAQSARAFMQNRPNPLSARIVEFVICPSVSSFGLRKAPDSPPGSGGDVGEEVVLGGVDCIELQILLYAKESQSIAKEFWQHTGDGVSSRYAERALAFLGESPAGPLDEPLSTPVGTAAVSPGSMEEAASSSKLLKKAYSRNRHYGRTPSRQLSVNGKPGLGSLAATTPVSTPPQTPRIDQESRLGAAPPLSDTRGATPPYNTNMDIDVETQDLPTELESLSLEHSVYLEERYGRNLPLASASMAKQALRRRIAGVLLPYEKAADSGAGAQDQLVRGGGANGISTGKEGLKTVTEDEIYLYPTGMSAISHAHELSCALRAKSGKPAGKSVCFGFPYTDTLKTLQKWGPGCHFFQYGTSADLDLLSTLLDRIRATSSEAPLQALFCEFASNPLLRSPDLVELRRLADEHGFLIVVDETVGNFVNIEVATWADVVVSSLTKVFSGDTNVMGGSLVLNPNGPYFAELKTVLVEIYEDNYFPEDAIYMERNSRDFRRRVAQINDNGYDLTDYLYSKSLANPDAPKDTVLKQVYYPRFVSPENYAAMQRMPSTGRGGFGGLFSLTFTDDRYSEAFYDALDCFKGPSLGTNFTLSCLYTILAHYMELDFAKDCGVEKGLVRVSVGLEDLAYLKDVFDAALSAAEAVRDARV